MPYYGPSGGTGGTISDATTGAAGKVTLADSADLVAGTGNDVLTAGLVTNAQNETGVAKVQFIPYLGVVTGTDPWTIIIEDGA